jgi:hypothetical protein
LLLPSIYRPGFRPNTQRLEPSGRRQMVTWPSGGATGIAMFIERPIDSALAAQVPSDLVI